MRSVIGQYDIGGYQVIKKWLSYREAKLLGRPLTKEEVRYVQEMAAGSLRSCFLSLPSTPITKRSSKRHFLGLLEDGDELR